MPPALSNPILAQASYWMLGWLAAAAAPILIHLWSRQKYQQTWWAAMEYLLAAVRRSHRRIRLERWLLLAVRTLIIVVVVLAVFESLCESPGLGTVSGGRTHRVLVLDGSYSMAYRPKDESRFDRAKQLARQIVEASRPGDAFTMALMSAPPRVVVGRPALHQDELLDEIDQIQLRHTTADLPATVEKVSQLIQDVGREDPGLARHEVLFLTDLGRVGWAPELSAAADAAFRQRSQELAESAALSIIDVGQPTAENVAAIGLGMVEPVATVAQSVTLEASLKNFGRQRQEKQRGEWWIDGRQVEQQQVDLAPGGQATVSLSYRFDTPGDHTVEVRADGDALDVDNHRFLALPVRQSLRVLCINGRPSGEPFGGATDFLVYALAPRAERNGRPLVQPEVAPESALLERGLADYDCVFLCDVAQFTSSEARVLDAYLRGGGNLVFFLGDQVLADRYNRELGGQEGRPRILPARLGPVVDQPSLRLDPRGYRHPIVQPFRGRDRAGLLDTPVLKHFKLELPEDARANVVLATATGDPLIVEEPVGRGRVVLVATSADVSWTPMPIWPSYVPIVQELLFWCIGGQLQSRNVEVGQPLVVSLASAASDVPWLVRGPTGRTWEGRLRGGAGAGGVSHPDTWLSGIYTLRLGPPIERSQNYAVNVNTAESDLGQLDEETLRNEVWPGVAFEHHTQWQDLERPAAAPIVRPRRLHIEMLFLALAMLCLETFLAWRFGAART